jgi:hypothetical protein
MKINKTVKLDENVLLQEVDNETILLDVKTSDYFSLNEIGTMFYKLIQEEPNLDLVLEELTEHFEVPKEKLKDDLLAFVYALEEKGLLSLY